MNCVVPPLPTPRRCIEVGAAIASIVREALPAGMRVAIMATGGLSHDPGGPKYFEVDEAFDRWFLGLMERGDREQVVRDVTIERMIGAGDGGTTELLAWLVALGAAGSSTAETICYAPSAELRCGMGAVLWNLAPVTAGV